MTTTKLQGNPVEIFGDLPKLNSTVKNIELIKNDLSVATLENYKNKKKVLNIFPSIDTGVCATSIRQFNKMATELKNTVVLNISMDLPFAQSRFCGAEGIKNCETLSGFRSHFGEDFGVKITSSPLAGLYARSVIILDENNKVIYSELVPEITQEPNYQAALASLN